MKKIKKQVLILGWVFLVFLGLTLSVRADDDDRETFGYTDVISSGDGELFYFTYSDEYSPYNPTLDLILEVDDTFSCEECSEISGSIYLRDKKDTFEVDLVIDVEYSKKDGYDIENYSDEDEDKVFDIAIILYAQIGENKYSIDIKDAIKDEIDSDLYVNEDSLESRELSDFIYEEKDVVLLNGEEKEEHELKKSLKDSMVIGVFYSYDSDVKVKEIGLGCFGIPDTNNGAYTVFLVVSATGGSATLGYGLYKRRQRGS